MSVSRLREDAYLDVNKDRKITAQDATLILQMAGQSTGELTGGPDCSGSMAGRGPDVPPPEKTGGSSGVGHDGGGPDKGQGPGADSPDIIKVFVMRGIGM